MYIKKRSAVFACIILGAVFLVSASCPQVVYGQEQTCEADTDVNNDGMVLSVADLTYLHHYIFNDGPAPPIPYKADLNGDCMVDQLDYELYQRYFIEGLAVFGPYGGFPPPACCEPDMTIGGCCAVQECRRLNPANCLAEQGEYWGDGSSCYQMPGDANDDGMVNVSDVVYLIGYFYKGGAAPPTPANGDPNGDCLVDFEDIVSLVCIFDDNPMLRVECTCHEPDLGETPNCLPGDANNDTSVNIGDAVYMINFVFNGGPEPEPFRILSGDANNDGEANVGDAVFVINYVFNHGPSPGFCIEWIVYRPCFHPDGYWID
jgi:hypothetical protein